MNATAITKTAKLVNALESGVALTAKQIRSRYKLVNPSSTIDRLRSYGLEIPLHRRNTGKNVYYLR